MSRKGLLVQMLEHLETSQYLCEDDAATPDNDGRIYQQLVDLVDLCNDAFNQELAKESVDAADPACYIGSASKEQAEWTAKSC